MLREIMIKHFNQAQGTPLTTTKWKQRLNDPQFLERIRRGDFSDIEEESEPIVRYFQTIHKSATPQNVTPIQYSHWNNGPNT